ncbi:hypothetical protein VVT58_22050 (plasmid) [Sphingobium sp. SJ10-10]|nr:hypothetical protein [Sphingobium sp. SJ10-10]
MGKKKMSGSREPRKPKKEKLPKSAGNTVSNVLSGDKVSAKTSK